MKGSQAREGHEIVFRLICMPFPFARTQDVPLLETRLYFLESDIVGHAQKKEKELDRAVEKIKEVKAGVLSQDYRAKPDWHSCSFCEFRTICPDSYAY